MGTRIFFFLLGFGLMIVGFTSIILYLNLMTFGFTFLEYVSFLLRRIECWFSFIGFLLMTCSIFWKGGKSYDLYL